VGKDVVLKRMKERGYPFHFVVTTTDRPRRAEEVQGVDYFFVSTQEFERMIQDDELLEYATVYGQHKGIARAQVKEALVSNRDVMMRLDVQGAATIRNMAPEAVLVFLSCESEEALAARLMVAWQEMKRLPEFDYLVINHTDRLDETVDTIAAIIATEKCRVRQRKITL